MEIKIGTETVKRAAARRGCTPEEYVARLASISFGRLVCAHLERTEDNGATSVFLVV